ncbi:MAG TPA: PAS domain-containing protein [Tepidisphaeraceae bacterium]|nr:PAS domain-containing protein [Tepidisphaeraceae bacterium]
MQAEPINLLLVDHSDRDVFDVARNLADSPVAVFELKRVDRVDAAQRHLETNRTDVVLLDLPPHEGREVLARLKQSAPSVPVVVLTDSDDDATALEAVRGGAQDFFVKGKVNGDALAHGLRYAIERKRAEEALQKSEAFYHSLVESLPQNILRKDLDGRFTFGNVRFCKEMGKTLEQIVGRTDFDFFPKELAEKYRADDRWVIESGKPIDVVEKHVTPDGETLYVQVIKSPVYDAVGNVIGTQGFFWDVTEKYRAEEELRQANADLAAKEDELLKTLAALKQSHEQLIQAQLHLIQAEKMESVGRLAAGVAHEVKNPLAIISMGLEYIDETCNISKLEADVYRAMREAVLRADSIIRGLVDFSADRKLDATPHNLNAMIERALLLVKHELISAHVTAETQLAADLPQVRLDATKIQQVFVNLFMNAIHAMSGGGTLRVRTYEKTIAGDEPPGLADRFVRGTRAVVAEVDDTGHGIPPDKLAKVWDPFFTTKGTGRGTGLGLTVTRKIVELHGGAIRIANRPEGGARVAVVLTPGGSDSNDHQETHPRR